VVGIFTIKFIIAIRFLSRQFQQAVVKPVYRALGAASGDFQSFTRGLVVFLIPSYDRSLDLSRAWEMRKVCVLP
jgi:hypothetical protein